MNLSQEYEYTLMVKTAWYYYMENYTQQHISELLGISRARVISLLEKARKTGIIKFTIRNELDRRMQIEKTLMAQYELKDVFIVPKSETLTDLNDSIAKAAAMYVNNSLEENGFINMGYGDTPSRILNYLATLVEVPINVVSLTGGVNYYLPNTSSSVFNARLYLMPSPLLLSSVEMVKAMEEEPSVEEIRRMTAHSSMSVVGIGGMSDHATIIKNGILSKNDFTLLSMQGAVGDILSHFIDKDGNPIDTSIENRLMSTPLSTLSDLEKVIGVAGGANKVDAILAVLRARYLDVLITDEETAETLLQLDKL